MIRIAVVSGSFRPGFSYQENLWTEALTRRGHDVRVFSPGMRLTASTARSHAPGYTRVTVPARGLARRHIFHSITLAPAVRAFDPALILWFGPPQGFGVDVARDRALAGVPLVAFMGQNRQMHTFDWRDRAAPARERALAVAYRLLRGPAVRIAARRADLLVTNTPETAGIVLDLLPPAERGPARQKLRPTPLGFDPRVFTFDPALRAARRAADEIFPGRIVAAVSSRFAPEKQASLDLVFAGLEAAMQRAPRLDALWIGFDGGPVSRRFAAAIEASPRRLRFRRMPFLSRAALGAAFQAADLAVFARPSISAQEALGTGLFGLLADGGSMDWLLTGPEDGRLFAAGSSAALADGLVAAVDHLAGAPADARSARAARARRLGYDRLIDGVLAGLGERNPLRADPIRG